VFAILAGLSQRTGDGTTVLEPVGTVTIDRAGNVDVARLHPAG
jgi:hypothetical protein